MGWRKLQILSNIEKSRNFLCIKMGVENNVEKSRFIGRHIFEQEHLCTDNTPAMATNFISELHVSECSLKGEASYIHA